MTQCRSLVSGFYYVYSEAVLGEADTMHHPENLPSVVKVNSTDPGQGEDLVPFQIKELCRLFRRWRLLKLSRRKMSLFEVNISSSGGPPL